MMATPSHMPQEAQRVMLLPRAPQRYEPDLQTPIGTLHDAVQAQCDRARRMAEEALRPLRRLA
jgi:hypothetical protein